MKETELRVDRIEEGLAVAYDEDGREYTFCAKLADVAENDILLATLGESDAVVAATKLTDKTNAAKQDMQARLNRLFDKRGN